MCHHVNDNKKYHQDAGRNLDWLNIISFPDIIYFHPISREYECTTEIMFLPFHNTEKRPKKKASLTNFAVLEIQ